MTKRILSLLMLALIITACASRENESAPEASSAASTTAAPMNDAEIVNLLMTVNTEEMNLAKLGKKQAQNKRVREFAAHMMNRHAKNNDEATKLRDREQIKLSETTPSNRVKIVTEESIELMKKMKGKDFDRAYMEVQVDLHQKTLEKLETSLIPNAQNMELKTMLQKTKGEVEQHLQMAQTLQSAVQ